jgi:hypothetical protein
MGNKNKELANNIFVIQFSPQTYKTVYKTDDPHQINSNSNIHKTSTTEVMGDKY